MVIVGEGWSQKLIFHNVDTWNSTAKITFYTNTGALFPVEVLNVGTNSSFTINVPVGKTLVMELATKFFTQQLGCAKIEQYTTGPTASGDYSGIGDMFGQIVFRKQSPGLPDFMCSLVLGGLGFRKTTTYFDNTNGNFTGMEILTSDPNSTSTANVALRVTVRDINGSVIATKVIQQKHKTLYWFNLGVDFPETINRTGTFEVEVVDTYSTYLSAFSLQFAGNGAFTIITPFED